MLACYVFYNTVIVGTCFTYIYLIIMYGRGDRSSTYPGQQMSFARISSSEYSAQGQVLHCKLRNQGRSSVQKQVFTANSGTQAAVLLGMDRCSNFPFLSAPHSLFASEQSLNDLKRSQWHQSDLTRVDLTNWVLWTPLKFTTGFKYQFHQGFWPDQTSGNLNARIYSDETIEKMDLSWYTVPFINSRMEKTAVSLLSFHHYTGEF